MTNTTAGTYVYFISYAHPSGFGNTTLAQTVPLNDYSHVVGAGEAIKNQFGYQAVSVLGWQLLSSPDTANTHEALTSLYANLSRACEAANQHLDDENADRKALAETLTNYVHNARTAVGALIGH